MVFQAAKTRESQLRSARLRISLTKNENLIQQTFSTTQEQEEVHLGINSKFEMLQTSSTTHERFHNDLTQKYLEFFSEPSAWEKCGPATMFSYEPCSKPSCVLLDGLIPLIRILTMDSDNPRLCSSIPYNHQPIIIDQLYINSIPNMFDG